MELVAPEVYCNPRLDPAYRDLEMAVPVFSLLTEVVLQAVIFGGQ